MLSTRPSCMSRQHPKRFENQTSTRPRKWVNSTYLLHEIEAFEQRVSRYSSFTRVYQ